MGKILAVDLFSSWAEMGKDEGMETGHAPSVESVSYTHLTLPTNREV